MPLDTLIAYVGEKPLSHYKPLAVANEEWANYLVVEKDKPAINAHQAALDAITPYTFAEPPPYLWDKGREGIDLPGEVGRQMALRLVQEARARLAQPGVWCQGVDYTVAHQVPGGYRFCARGVVLWLAERFRLGGGRTMAMVALARHAGFRPSPICAPHGVVAAFNDHPETTLKDVLAWFGRTIVYLERQRPPSPGGAA